MLTRFAFLARQVQERNNSGEVLILIDAISTPFQRHVNAISTPFQRHVNAMLTPFQRHFNAMLTPF